MASLLPLVVALGFGIGTLPVAAADSCSVRSGTTAVPLVELYTSEGCSSCPPADRWLSGKVGDQGANWLAFHVDYWDDIGWPDRFASPEYSRRQRQRVGARGGATVYTPQVMVGSDVRVSWRSDGRFKSALLGTGGNAEAGLALRAQREKGGLNVRLGAVRSQDSDANAQVWLAQYVDGQSTQVRAGENRGATLRHDRVVRNLWGPWKLDGTPLSRRQQVEALVGQWGLVAFVQDASGRTLQSLQLPVSQCGAADG